MSTNAHPTRAALKFAVTVAKHLVKCWFGHRSPFGAEQWPELAIAALQLACALLAPALDHFVTWHLLPWLFSDDAAATVLLWLLLRIQRLLRVGRARRQPHSRSKRMRRRRKVRIYPAVERGRRRRPDSTRACRE